MSGSKKRMIRSTTYFISTGNADTMDSLWEELAKKTNNDEVNIKYYRNGKKHRFKEGQYQGTLLRYTGNKGESHPYFKVAVAKNDDSEEELQDVLEDNNWFYSLSMKELKKRIEADKRRAEEPKAPGKATGAPPPEGEKIVKQEDPAKVRQGVSTGNSENSQPTDEGNEERAEPNKTGNMQIGNEIKKMHGADGNEAIENDSGEKKGKEAKKPPAKTPPDAPVTNKPGADSQINVTKQPETIEKSAPPNQTKPQNKSTGNPNENQSKQQKAELKTADPEVKKSSPVTQKMPRMDMTDLAAKLKQQKEKLNTAATVPQKTDPKKGDLTSMLSNAMNTRRKDIADDDTEGNPNHPYAKYFTHLQENQYSASLWLQRGYEEKGKEILTAISGRKNSDYMLKSVPGTGGNDQELGNWLDEQNIMDFVFDRENEPKLILDVYSNAEENSDCPTNDEMNELGEIEKSLKEQNLPVTLYKKSQSGEKPADKQPEGSKEKNQSKNSAPGGVKKEDFKKLDKRFYVEDGYTYTYLLSDSDAKKLKESTKKAKKHIPDLAKLADDIKKVLLAWSNKHNLEVYFQKHPNNYTEWRKITEMGRMIAPVALLPGKQIKMWLISFEGDLLADADKRKKVYELKNQLKNIGANILNIGEE